MEPFGVAAIQHVIRCPISSPGIHQENVERSLALIRYVAGRPDRPRLVLCPDWHPLSGFGGADRSGFEQSAIQMPGPETEKLSDLARGFGIYIGGACLERDPDWPNHIFKTAFLIGPDGSMVLKYRSHNGAMQQGISSFTCPGDIYNEYVECYGFDALFPTAMTSLGKVGMMVGDDVNFPEVARHLTLNGAEVLLHVGGEPLGAGTRESWTLCRRTRAYENVAYLVSTGYTLAVGDGTPVICFGGGSEIVDFRGRPLAFSDHLGDEAITGILRIEQLRHQREGVRFNIPALSRLQLYAAQYRNMIGFPNNTLGSGSEKPIGDPGSITREVIEQYYESGRWVRPELRAHAVD